MKVSELKTYLGIVLDLEKERYLQERMVQQLERRIAQLGHPKKLYRPVKKEVHCYEVGSLLFGAFIVGAVPGGIIGLFSGGLFSGGLIRGALIGGIILSLLAGILEISNYCRRQDEAQAEYENLLSRYEQDEQADAIRVRAERKALEFLKQELNLIRAHATKTDNFLKACYARNIIFEKYRGLSMVASLYEYISAGRCSTLEGHEGAYNILETEMRLDRIIVSLDTIISQLEDIKYMQRVLYDVVTEANETLHNLLSASDGIESSIRQLTVTGEELSARAAALQTTSTLNLYFSELTQKELHYRNQLGLRA